MRRHYGTRRIRCRPRPFPASAGRRAVGLSPVEAGLSITIGCDSLPTPTMESYQADQPIGDLAIHAVTPKGRAVFMQRYR